LKGGPLNGELRAGKPLDGILKAALPDPTKRSDDVRNHLRVKSGRGATTLLRERPVNGALHTGGLRPSATVTWTRTVFDEGIAFHELNAEFVEKVEVGFPTSCGGVEVEV
jgi:hypothetical protein